MEIYQKFKISKEKIYKYKDIVINNNNQFKIKHQMKIKNIKIRTQLSKCNFNINNIQFKIIFKEKKKCKKKNYQNIKFKVQFKTNNYRIKI